jgi:small subunit ribosomal protein S27Ae
LGVDGIYYVTVDAEGGKKKKKKKKNWAKPKKKKHRHRKVKLATLKLYSVDGKGTV